LQKVKFFYNILGRCWKKVWV